MSSQDQQKSDKLAFRDSLYSLDDETCKSLLQEKSFDLLAVTEEYKKLKKRKQFLEWQTATIRDQLGVRQRNQYRPFRYGEFIRYPLFKVLESKVYPSDAPLNANWVMGDQRYRTAKDFYICLKGEIDSVDRLILKFGDRTWRRDRNVLCTNDVYAMTLALQAGMEFMHFYAKFKPQKRWTEPIHECPLGAYFVRSAHGKPLEDYPDRIVFSRRGQKRSIREETTVHQDSGPVQGESGGQAASGDQRDLLGRAGVCVLSVEKAGEGTGPGGCCQSGKEEMCP